MLKGLDGVTTHEHREWIPIVENEQDMTRLAAQVAATLERAPGRARVRCSVGMGSTPGADAGGGRTARRILEFLFEVVGRTLMLTGPRAS